MKYRAVAPSTEAALNAWARQKRALYVEEQQPIASILGQLKKDRNAAGAAEARSRQKWQEVYTGDGMVVQKIVVTLRELPRFTLTSYYLLRGPWRVDVGHQAEEVGISRRDFWRNLELAEHCVDVGLQLLSDAPKRAA